METETKIRKEALRLIKDYIKWRKLEKGQVWDIFDLIHLSHKGKTWKYWVWDKLAEDNKISDKAINGADILELVIRLFNIQVEEIRGYSRIRKTKKGGLNSSQP